MLFWILVGLAVLVVVAVIVWWTIEEGFGLGIMGGILSALTAGACLLGAMGLLNMVPWTQVGDAEVREHKLSALGSSSEVEGRFSGGIFVSSGYVNEEPVFRYIRSEGNGFVLRSVSADDTVVYQGDYEPRIEITSTEWGNEFLYPWTYEYESYALYVPEGSVSNEISVAP